MLEPDSSYAVSISEVKDADITDSTVTLTWTVSDTLAEIAPENLSERYNIIPGTISSIKENEDKSVTAVISNLEAATDYTFTVYQYVTVDGLDSYGKSEISATTHEDETPPAVPTQFTAKAATEDSITIQWINPSDSDLKYVNLDVSGTYTKDGDQIPVSVTKQIEIASDKIGRLYTYKIEGLPRLKTAVEYTIKINAEDGNENKSTDASIVASTVADEVAPSAPVVKSQKVRDTSVEFTFDKVDSDATSIKVSGSLQGSFNYTDGISTVSFTSLTKDTIYNLSFAVEDEAGNVSEALELSVTAKNPEVSDITAQAGYTGQIVVSWTKPKEQGLKYAVKATHASYEEKNTPSVTDVAQLAVSGLETGTQYNVSVIVYDGDTKLSECAATNVPFTRVVLYQLKSGANERMIHPAIRQPTYSLSYVTADGYQVVASDHDNKSDGPDFDRASSLYNYWVVMPGLSDPTDSEKFSLVASAPAKSGNSVTNPTYSGLYAVFDVANQYVIPSGSVSSGVSGVNSVQNKLIVKTLSDLSENDFANATFTKTENVSDKDPTGKNDSPAYKPYALFKSDSGLYFTQECKIICGKSSSTTSNEGIVARQEFFYEEFMNFDYIPLAPVTNAQYTDLQAESVTLTWKNPSDEDFDGVVITYGSNTVLVGKTETSKTFTGLSSNTSYTFEIRAKDKANNLSSVVSIDATTLTSPKATSVKAANFSTGTILVTWTDASNPNVTGYEVYIDDTLAQTVNTGVEKCYITGKTVGQTYSIKIKSIGVDNQETDAVSITAAERFVRVLGQSGRYLLDANIVDSTKYGSFWAKLNQTATAAYDSSSVWIVYPGTGDYADNPLAFRLKNYAADLWLMRDSDTTHTLSSSGSPVGGINSDNNTTIAIVAEESKASTFTIEDAVSGNSDYFSARYTADDTYYLLDWWQQGSIRAHGTGNDLQYACIKFEDVEKPELPAFTVSNLTATPKKTEITLNWDNPDGVRYVVIKEATTGNSIKTSETSATFTELTLGTSYEFTLTAYDEYGKKSSASETIKTSTADKVDYPMCATAVTKYTEQAVVTWIDADYGSDYVYTVTLSSDGKDDIVKSNIAQGIQQAVFTGLEVGTEYTVTVKSDKSEETTTTTVTPKIVLWKIANTFEVDSKGVYKALFGVNKAGNATGQRFVQTADWDDITFDAWIVRPSLSAPEDSDQFSLEMSTDDVQKTGLYMAMATNSKITYVDDGRVTKGWGWGYNNSEDAHFWVLPPATVESSMESLSYASFEWAEDSTCGTSTNKDSFGKWMCLKVAPGTENEHYVYDASLVLSAKASTEVSSGDYAFAYKETLYTTYGNALSEEEIASVSAAE
ncbi:MAG: fibronectin type III domain-containing protein [Spirochaetales bacterium]|nr:fibronectin type III domain-containing protein [Spirochaetales bacterium]